MRHPDEDGCLEDPVLAYHDWLNRPLVSVRRKGVHARGGWVTYTPAPRKLRVNNREGRGYIEDRISKKDDSR